MKVNEKTGALEDLFFPAQGSVYPWWEREQIYVERPPPIECSTYSMNFCTYKDFYRHAKHYQHIRNQNIKDICDFCGDDDYNEEYKKLADPRNFSSFYELPQFSREKALYDYQRTAMNHIRNLPLDSDRIKMMKSLTEIYHDVGWDKHSPHNPSIEQMRQTCIKYLIRIFENRGMDHHVFQWMEEL